jgi:drug/metabolite transporter (DMT)-like permease
MGNSRIILLSILALFLLLAGLVALALPDPYEGQVLYEMDPAHSIRTVDVGGLGLVLIGGLVAWGAGWLWQRRMAP